MKRGDIEGLENVMMSGQYRDVVSSFEKVMLEKRLRNNAWNVTRTATELGLERSHLYKKMKALGIEKPEIS